MGHRWECDGPSMAHGWAALGSQLGWSLGNVYNFQSGKKLKKVGKKLKKVTWDLKNAFFCNENINKTGTSKVGAISKAQKAQSF